MLQLFCRKPLLPLIRYIHLNPVRAGIIEAAKLNEYPWTGHKELIKNRGEYKIIETEKVLSFFGAEKKEAIELYVDFVNAGLNLKEDYRGGGLIRSAGGLEEVLRRKPKERENYDERILGRGDFVDQVLEKVEQEEKATGKIKGIEDVLERLNGYYGLKKDEILSTRSKGVREARSVLAYIGSQYLHKRVTEIGKILGINQSAASIAKRKGQDIFLRDKLEQKLLL
ncbi:MAG: hypothetical protein HY920_00970 [Elusimicrobia bacterium]|nr:hypothetical protein [Elusimicrobiota bacterium]